MTLTEKIIWEELRNRKLNGIKFKRQYGLGPYILDFFAPSINLALEIDGGIHNRLDVKQKDQNKDAFLHEAGVSVLRIKNKEVLEGLDDTLKRIASMTSPNPS